VKFGYQTKTLNVPVLKFGKKSKEWKN